MIIYIPILWLGRPLDHFRSLFVACLLSWFFAFTV